MKTRTLQRVIGSVRTSDGAGVALRRSIGKSSADRVDPFLMLDEFFSDDPDDYLAGFPSHPHRGFETVTYMLDGHMRHEDHLGNRGDLGPGAVQWMTAGRGIIHSEMPQQSAGRMRGFQLWLNLPAKEKMKPASYRDIAAAEVPRVDLENGGVVKVIAGTLIAGERSVPGPVRGGTTAPLYFDVQLPAGARFDHVVPAEHSVFVYVYEGSITAGDATQKFAAGAGGVLTDGDRIELSAGRDGARVLVLAACPLHEPLVQYGPFVMNTVEEIERAVADYRSGTLA